MKSLLSLSPRLLKWVLIGVPALVMALYLTVLAADRYVSEATVAVRVAGETAASLPGAALLMAGVTPPSREEAFYLQRYLHSLPLLQEMDREFDLRKHFASPVLDWPYRLSAGASQEDFLDYYRQRVQLAFDDQSSILTVRVQGFDPEFAQRLNTRILELSEKFVNELSHRIARERLRFAETELGSAAERLQQAKEKVLAFQTKNQVLDPTVQAQASGMLVIELQASLTRRETELKGLLGFLNDSAPQVRQLRGEIAALKSQIASERVRATTAERREQRLTTQAAEFLTLRTQADFAADLYKLALTTVETARIDTARKLKTLVVIEPPSLPETAEYPQRLYSFATLLAACLLLYAIARLVLATIREHQD
jgi:capsular polysaccharide transport system permease protein